LVDLSHGSLNVSSNFSQFGEMARPKKWPFIIQQQSQFKPKSTNVQTVNAAATNNTKSKQL